MDAATLDMFKARILETIRASLLPIIYVNVDLWKSKIACEKFLGKLGLLGCLQIYPPLMW